MKITIIGTGYVGLITGVCFAEKNNQVICADIDEKKIAQLSSGVPTLYENGLKELLEKTIQNKTIHFTTNIKESVENSDIIFIAVGTPMSDDGSADLKYVFDVAQSIGKYMNRFKIIVDKSTVPVGTAFNVKKIIDTELLIRNEKHSFEVISNPEFLKEGVAIENFMNPDRIVIGTENYETAKMMKELYLPFVSSEENIIVMDVLSAEMTKYAANAMLATKISFINEIATICEKVGADVNKVKIGIGSDKRIGNHFINPGCGYGGSCFPKDVQALIKTAHNNFYSPKLLNAVESVNKQQKIFFFLKISNYFKHSLENKTFAICGLSFKPETDDMREAPSLIIVQKLIENGAVVKVYDPQSMKHAQDYYFKNYDEEQLIYSSSLYDCAKGADCLVVLTEWKEFKNADMEIIKKQLKKPVIFDGRNIFNKKELVNKGFECFQIGN